MSFIRFCQVHVSIIYGTRERRKGLVLYMTREKLPG